MIKLIWFYLILLVVGIFIYKSANEIKKENQTLDSELENYKKEVGIQYRQKADLWNEQQGYVKEFNELAKNYLKMKKDAIDYEKMHSKEIYEQNYEKEYNQWKEFAGKKNDGDIGKKRKFIKFVRRKLNHTKKLMKEMSERYSEVKLEKEITENDLKYMHSNAYFTILWDVLKKWALIILIVCVIWVEIQNNPLFFVLLLALVVVLIISCIISDKFDIEIVFILPAILGIVTLGYMIISLVLNIGYICICFIMIYFRFVLFIGLVWGLYLYKENLESEREQIKKRIQLAQKKLIEWERGSIEEDIEKLGDLVKYLYAVFDSIELDKNEGNYAVAYWDFLFLGTSFLLGMENGLNSTFVNQCIEQIDKLENIEWRDKNESTNQ